MSQQNQNSPRGHAGTVFHESLAAVARILTNPLFLFGSFFGIVFGWFLCYVCMVFPMSRNLAQREAQLEKWSELNQQMQQLAMQNREMTQSELKRMVAMNQEAATRFAEVERALHQRELRLTTIPVGFMVVPLLLIAMAFLVVLLMLRTMSQRAIATVESVVHLAPAEMVQEIMARHASLLTHAPPRSLPSP